MQLAARKDGEKKENQASEGANDYFRKLRRLVHTRLIDTIQDDGIKTLDHADEIRERVQWIINDLNAAKGATISADEHQQLEHEIMQELSGMGPLTPLMLEPDITDILVNGPEEVWVDRGHALERTDVRFDDEAHLRRFLDRIVSSQGRHLDSSNPMVDAKLADGSRLHAVIAPLCNRGAVVSIRRFRNDDITADKLIGLDFLSEEMLKLLQTAVAVGVNVVIAGSAGAGKTTLLNILSKSIPATQRIVTVEETAELRLDHPHVISLEARQSNMEGLGEIELRDLVKTSLRMRADRIVVGEVRGGEVMDMLQAMNVGHNGSMTTVHANSSSDVVRRLEALALMNDAGVPRESVREMIGSAVQLVVHVARFRDGVRRVTSIGEVRLEHDSIDVDELYTYQVGQVDTDGCIHGTHVFTGLCPRFLKQAQARGFEVDASGFSGAVPS